jgi:L-arabinokinase
MDRLNRSMLCGRAVSAVLPTRAMRHLLSALGANGDNSLLQVRFTPQLSWEALEMPAQTVIVAARTRLDRPTTTQRLLETRICAEMGHRMIVDLLHRDGQPRPAADERLSAITPAEYVERFRDRLPTRITGQAFSDRFGALRGIDRAPDPKGTYKIRSRAEHIIYENKRVHEFAAAIVRARRNNEMAPLVKAGELMYASHWSHSQRCGIGGVETDQFVNSVRQRGVDAGLFGAKVTGGGSGGELVVLMRDDARARTALAEAVEEASRISNRSIEVFDGCLCGAELFSMPEVDLPSRPRSRVEAPHATV